MKKENENNIDSNSSTSSALEKSRKLILTGPVLVVLLTLVWPFILQVILQMMTGFVDHWMIGQYGVMNGLGPDPLAAIGLSRNMLMLIFSIAMGLGIGLSTLVAQYTGKGDHKKAVTVAIDTFWFLALFSVVIMILGHLFLKDFIEIYNSSDSVNAYLLEYMNIFLYGMPVILLSLVVFNLMQGTGDTVTPMIVLTIMNISNVIFNWIFIPGPAVFGIDPAGLGFSMGMEGAAVGTLISRAIGCFIAFGLMFSGIYRIDLRKAERFLPSMKGFAPVVRVALPTAAQMLSRNVSVLILNVIISYSIIHEKAHAVLNTGFLIEWIPFGPAMAMMQASAIIVGQSIGAGLKDRAEKATYTAFAFSFVIMCLNAVLFWYWPEKLASIFTDDAEVITSMAIYLKIIGIGDIFLSALIFVGAIRAAGDAFWPMVINITALWVVRLPLSYFVMNFTELDYTGVWLAMGFSQVLQGIALVFLFRSGKWKKIKLIDTDEVDG